MSDYYCYDAGLDIDDDIHPDFEQYINSWKVIWHAEHRRKEEVGKELHALTNLLCMELFPLITTMGWTLGPRFKPACTALDVRKSSTLSRVLRIANDGPRYQYFATIRSALSDDSLADSIKRRAAKFCRLLVDNIKAKMHLIPPQLQYTTLCVGAYWDGKETASVGIIFCHTDDVPSPQDPKSEAFRRLFELDWNPSAKRKYRDESEPNLDTLKKLKAEKMKGE